MARAGAVAHAVEVAQAATVEVAQAVAVVVAEERMMYRPVMIYLLIHSLIQMYTEKKMIRTMKTS